jgi:hypothetical protein
MRITDRYTGGGFGTGDAPGLWPDFSDAIYAQIEYIGR